MGEEWILAQGHKAHGGSEAAAAASSEFHIPNFEVGEGGA
jgi:hypothetical protein